MDEPIKDLPKIGAPATRALVAEGYTDLAQLEGVSQRALQLLHGTGPRALRIVQQTLEERGLSLGE